MDSHKIEAGSIAGFETAIAAHRAIGSRPGSVFHWVTLPILIEAAYLECHRFAGANVDTAGLDDQLFKAWRFQESFGIFSTKDIEIVADLDFLLQQALPEAIQLEFAAGIFAGVTEQF